MSDRRPDWLRVAEEAEAKHAQDSTVGAEIDVMGAAHYVLRAAGMPGSWMQPGSFYEALTSAALRADPENLVRISRGFPILAECVRVYRQDPDLLKEMAGA